MILTAIDIIILVTIANLAFFSVFLMIYGLRVKRELVWLSLFFLSLACNLFSYFTFRHGAFFYAEFPHVLYVGYSFVFAYAPCVYLCVRRAVMDERFKPLVRLVHFAPFLVFTAYLAVFFYFRDAQTKRAILSLNTLVPPAAYVALTVFLQAQILFYAALIIRHLRRYRRGIKEFYSSVERIRYRWVKYLAAGCITLWAADCVRFYRAGLDETFGPVSETVFFALFIVFCYFILFYAFSGRPPVAQAVSAAPFSEKEREKKKNLSDATVGEYKARLLAVMNGEKPYLEPELSLVELAKMVGIPHRSLSEVIRSGLSDNFYNFINDYRVDEFVSLAGRPDMKDLNILELMLEAGFNTKSAFNKAFKRKLACSPKEYLRRKAESRRAV